MADLQVLIDKLIEFRDERNWEPFHNAKDLALALSIEAAELNELFLWKNREETEQVNKESIGEELADIFSYALLLANKEGLDVKKIVLDKLEKNRLKYPVEKARNKANKYTDL